MTKADLYESDVRLGERFTVILEAINGVGQRLTLHEQAHNIQSEGGNLDREIKNDAKKAGIAGAFLAAGTAFALVVKTLWGL